MVDVDNDIDGSNRTLKFFRSLAVNCFRRICEEV